MKPAPDYLNPVIPVDLPVLDMPVIVATPETVAPYGCLIDHPDEIEIEIVRWPAQGWRHIDEDTGNEGGTKEGSFLSQWEGDVLIGTNSAVAGEYILGYAKRPELAQRDHNNPPEELLLWHANYHPDGGQLFFPEQRKPFLVPVALPGDDIKPEHFVCFWCDGTQGLYIHPNIWHEGVFSISGAQRFFDKQGAVHARVSVDFPEEFGCMLRVDMTNLPKP